MEIKQIVKDGIDIMDKHKLPYLEVCNEMEFDNDKIGKINVTVNISILKKE